MNKYMSCCSTQSHSVLPTHFYQSSFNPVQWEICSGINRSDVMELVTSCYVHLFTFTCISNSCKYKFMHFPCIFGGSFSFSGRCLNFNKSSRLFYFTKVCQFIQKKILMQIVSIKQSMIWM